MKVLRTIYRGFGQTFKYAEAGQMVEFVSDHGNILIVEDITGNRFPIMKEDVSADPMAPLIATELKESETVIIKKKIKPVQNNLNNQLF